MLDIIEKFQSFEAEYQTDIGNFDPGWHRGEWRMVKYKLKALENGAFRLEYELNTGPENSRTVTQKKKLRMINYYPALDVAEFEDGLFALGNRAGMIFHATSVFYYPNFNMAFDDKKQAPRAFRLLQTFAETASPGFCPSLPPEDLLKNWIEQCGQAPVEPFTAQFDNGNIIRCHYRERLGTFNLEAVSEDKSTLLELYRSLLEKKPALLVTSSFSAAERLKAANPKWKVRHIAGSHWFINENRESEFVPSIIFPVPVNGS